MPIKGSHILPSNVKIVWNRMDYVAGQCFGKTVLHLGCADAGLTTDRFFAGHHLHAKLLSSARRVFGIDIDEKGIDFLRRHGVKDVYVGNVYHLDKVELPEKPDIIVATELLEHLSNPGQFLDNLRSTYPDTPVILSVPNAYSWVAWQSMLDGLEQVHEDHNFYFSHKTLETLLQKHGYRIESEVVYSWGPPSPEKTAEFRRALARNIFFADGIVVTAVPESTGGQVSGGPNDQEAANPDDQLPVLALDGTASDEPGPQARYALGPAATSTLADSTSDFGASVATSPATVHPKRRLTFLAGDAGNFTFVRNIARELERDYQVELMNPGNQQAVQVDQIPDDGGIIWLEWANGPAISVSASPELYRKHPIVLRIHRYEIFSQTPRYINWHRIDAVIFVSRKAQESFRDLHPDQYRAIRRAFVVPNAVDLEKFRFRDRGPGFNLACTARIHPDKNLPLLVQCMDALRRIDTRYRCEVAGKVSDLALYRYLKQMVSRLNLDENLVFLGHVNDVSQWLDNKNYIVQTSVVEGHPVGLLEGMAMGLKPVVHSFYGIEEDMYPEGSVFLTPSEFADIVVHGDYQPSLYRDWVLERYSLAGQIRAIKSILEVATKAYETRRNRELFLEQSKKLLEAGNIDGAQELLMLLAKELPDDAQVLNDLGVILFMKGHADLARRLFIDALSFDPNHEEARYNLSVLQEKA
ncbi:MAG: glycosyltransferase [Candidatus Fermentithermobacillus carboniphilus]|uniref:Glycosyltransferase n=1 Tax=Candidatus Fermentithermobacillus carboniphilus TaxID=3085328 RepID=A0AAT9LE53_9FIRM|nr:MAG: glycosyltransferase [Candidatus Fermentithermobacillus carboniphilus]